MSRNSLKECQISIFLSVCHSIGFLSGQWSQLPSLLVNSNIFFLYLYLQFVSTPLFNFLKVCFIKCRELVSRSEGLQFLLSLCNPRYSVISFAFFQTTGLTASVISCLQFFRFTFLPTVCYHTLFYFLQLFYKTSLNSFKK